jgi:hypothetical protein
MASTQDFIDYVIDQIGIQSIKYRKMFGEYAIYVDTKVVALVCDNTLFIKKILTGDGHTTFPRWRTRPLCEPSFFIFLAN